jgi:hypothetical protein
VSFFSSLKTKGEGKTMAKRGQIVEEQAVEETARSIAQAQAVYEKRKGNEAYLHVFYKNFRETERHLHTLRLETRPEHYLHFSQLLEPIRRVASGIYFVGCDVAYDVPTSLENVVVIPADMRR